ncbi:MAG: geranylgeranylglycerol-phosphate geranylgeranyltransferase [Flavipsychrobacter sp.]|nr:geranylgeranylglycerol-phosphate geranylgeranyltransferase [Flavipsychrobacter sp.]
MAWLKLIRWKNLLIVFLTQLLVWACVLLPVKRYTGTPLLLGPLHFLFLSLSTVLIAAAGYIINDYFDIKIDLINRPEKMVLEKRIPRRFAILSHSALNIAGLLLAAYIARRAGHYEWLLLQLACTVLLWFYSSHFKRRFITGNVVVALLTALTVLSLLVYEPALHPYLTQSYFLQIHSEWIVNPVWVLGVYTYFAFTLTWMREIVKDMEDYKGDAEEGCVTMPIKIGLLKSARFSQLLGVLAITPLIIGSVKLCSKEWWALGLYMIVAVIAPLAWWILTVNNKATTEHYARASRNLKLIMLTGIGSLIIYYLQTNG